MALSGEYRILSKSIKPLFPPGHLVQLNKNEIFHNFVMQSR